MFTIPAKHPLCSILKPTDLNDPYFIHFTTLLIDRYSVTGLPDQPDYPLDIEFFLFHTLLFGRTILFKHHNNYFFGLPDNSNHISPYYYDTKFRITNPYLPSSSSPPTYSSTQSTQVDSLVLTPKNSCLIYSNPYAKLLSAPIGLYPLITSYCKQIHAFDKAITALTKNTRVIGFFKAQDNNTVESARLVLDSLFSDDSDSNFAVLQESLVDSLTYNPISTQSRDKFTELIKARQYYISELYSILGVTANQNMKSERLTDDETQTLSTLSTITISPSLTLLNQSLSANPFGLSIKVSLRTPDPSIFPDPLSNIPMPQVPPPSSQLPATGSSSHQSTQVDSSTSTQTEKTPTSRELKTQVIKEEEKEV